MHRTKLFILTSVLTLNTVFAQEDIENRSSFPQLEGPYVGQKTPGLTPEVFGPGIVSISGRYEHGISFSPDLDEVYFSANKKDEEPDVYFSKLEGKKWTPIKKANFTKGEKDAEMHPFVSLRDNRIYFTAYDSILSDENIWYVNRLDHSWSDAKKLDSPINDDLVFYPNTSKNGDLFYTSISKMKTYYASNKNGRYPKVHELGIEYGIHGFISPSQDFLVVNARNKEDERRKDNDIYVYFKGKDGKWTNPISLGNAINSNFNETCPSITPDGKYLFFGRYNEEGGLSNFYWVSAEVIDKVRPPDFKK
jgi:Tol biopolymer transport system component